MAVASLKGPETSCVNCRTIVHSSGPDFTDELVSNPEGRITSSERVSPNLRGPNRFKSSGDSVGSSPPEASTGGTSS